MDIFYKYIIINIPYACPLSTNIAHIYQIFAGVSCNMFFLSHTNAEDSIDETLSKTNSFEAEYVVQLSRYLILQGYESHQITILTMYSGQLIEVKRQMRNHDVLRNVRATVVDNFQGEESDIIILSFVRSNDRGDIGFLKVSNRVNVALSRAKKGLYCVGDFQCLSENSDIWKKIIAALKRQNAIGYSLKIFCQNHPNTVTHVSEGKDFRQVPDGGCVLRCDTRLSCGHVCPKACHVIDPEHLTACPKPCEKFCENGHRCRSTCHVGKNCKDCTILVGKLRYCQHLFEVSCHVNPNLMECDQPCNKNLRCKHKCGEPCRGLPF